MSRSLILCTLVCLIGVATAAKGDEHRKPRYLAFLKCSVGKVKYRQAMGDVSKPMTDAELLTKLYEVYKRKWKSNDIDCLPDTRSMTITERWSPASPMQYNYFMQRMPKDADTVDL
jgi:hypothetical protein